MSRPQATHHSYWSKLQDLRSRYPKLEGTERADVVVLGGGITGLSTALELLERGLMVIVLEALTIGAGTTGGSTGHLDCHPERGAREMLDQLGLETARDICAARRTAISKIEHRADGTCDVQRIPAYYYSENGEHRDWAAREMEACEQLGMDVEWTTDVPLPFFATGFRIRDMARLNSTAYVHRLAERVIAHGGKIFEQSRGEGPDGEQPHTMQVGTGVVEFDRLVVAVHSNFTNVQRIYLQIPPYQSYAMAVRVDNPPPDALYWDDAEPYFYTRRALTVDPQVLIIGGCDHRTGMGNPAEAKDKLSTYIHARYQVREVISQWSAELFEPVDGRPIIGLVPGTSNVWIATGLSGVGLTWGTAAGEIIASLVCDGSHKLEHVLSPSRFGLDGLGSLMQAHLATAADYSERVLPAHRFDPAELKPGEGKVGVVDHHFVAVCKDRHGCEHRFSPICTHMGGVVHWNEVEQTWDCPVHGGRFTADGNADLSTALRRKRDLDQRTIKLSLSHKAELDESNATDKQLCTFCVQRRRRWLRSSRGWRACMRVPPVCVHKVRSAASR
ncbi:MAG: FAD-dependent oxidoreductase [Pirellulales bacterium]